MTVEQAVWQDNDRMSGVLCFRNTRIPVSTLFDHLEAGKLQDFYVDFPDVNPEMVNAVLEGARELLETKFRGSSAA